METLWLILVSLSLLWTSSWSRRNPNPPMLRVRRSSSHHIVYHNKYYKLGFFSCFFFFACAYELKLFKFFWHSYIPAGWNNLFSYVTLLKIRGLFNNETATLFGNSWYLEPPFLFSSFALPTMRKRCQAESFRFANSIIETWLPQPDGANCLIKSKGGVVIWRGIVLPVRVFEMTLKKFFCPLAPPFWWTEIVEY